MVLLLTVDVELLGSSKKILGELLSLSCRAMIRFADAVLLSLEGLYLALYVASQGDGLP